MQKPNEKAQYKSSNEKGSEMEYHAPITKIVKTGNVRDMHVFNGLIFDTSNRLSAFDGVINVDVPLKGAMLNCISQYNKMLLNNQGFITDYIPESKNFFTAAGFDAQDVNRLSYAESLTMLPFKFIVSGYLVGSAYKAYAKGISYSGYTFSEGLQKGDKLPEPIVTPAIKEENGHDHPITQDECIEQLALWLRNNSIVPDAEDICKCYNFDFYTFACQMDHDSFDFADYYSSDEDWEYAKYAIAYQYAKDYLKTIYEQCSAIYSILSEHCENAGVMLINTKFEFGLNYNYDVVLANEVATPDYSYFAFPSGYTPNFKILSMDKQIVHDYCKTIGFKGHNNQPIPEISEELLKKISDRYVYIAKLICGEEFVKQYM